MYWKSKVVQEALAKICSSFVPCELEQCRSCLYGNFTNPIKRLLIGRLAHTLGSKMTVKRSGLVKQLMYVLKLF